MSDKSVQTFLRESLEAYFRDLDGIAPHDLYEMVMKTVEKPLLEVVMAQAGENQSRAAQWLGLGRNTLHKKLQEHNLI